MTCAGALRLRLAPGTALPAGAEITLLSAAARVGTFAAFAIEGDTTGAAMLELAYSGTTVTLRLVGSVAVPQWNDVPAAFSLVGWGGPDPHFELAPPAPGRVRVELFAVSGRRRVGRDAKRRPERTSASALIPGPPVAPRVDPA